MNPREYFSQIVLPTYLDFESDPTNLRKVFLTAIVLFHTLDYINKEDGGAKGHLGNLQERTCNQCLAFRLIKDIANGAKHVEIRRPKVFWPDEMQVYSKHDVAFSETLKNGIQREYRNRKSMLWVERDGRKHFVHTELFVVINYLAYEFLLGNTSCLEPPLQLVYRSST